jgi:2-polyprenyl-3-methyl-5-hydroxy-6-metoxy-1,4-benzoquinol methylase
MAMYYNKINSEYYSLNQNIEDKLENENIRNVDFLLKYKTKGKVLEIGCGYGFLLKEFQRKGFEVYGLEPSPHASNYAAGTLKLPIYNGFLTNDVFEKESFDCIVLFDVFEHIYDIDELMKSINFLLKPGGSLLIGTGNIESSYAKIAGKQWWYLSSWEHISFFSEKSIKYLLNKFDYKNIIIKNVSHKGSYYFNLIIVLKSFLKKVANLFTKHKYTMNVAFDHILVHAIKK